MSLNRIEALGESCAFVRDKCGYSVLSCAGSAAGMRVVVESYVCSRYLIVTDAAVAESREVRRVGRKEGDFVDTVAKPRPKCGGTMSEGGGVVCLWD